MPLAFSWPGVIPEDRPLELLASQCDVVPTILGLAGLAPFREADGVDLSDQVLGMSDRPVRDRLGSKHFSAEVIADRVQALESTLRPTDPQTVSFGYVVPKGQRNQERISRNLDLRYHGYVIEVYYEDRLQDRYAEPESLLP